MRKILLKKENIKGYEVEFYVTEDGLFQAKILCMGYESPLDNWFSTVHKHVVEHIYVHDSKNYIVTIGYTKDYEITKRLHIPPYELENYCEERYKKDENIILIEIFETTRKFVHSKI